MSANPPSFRKTQILMGWPFGGIQDDYPLTTFIPVPYPTYPNTQKIHQFPSNIPTKLYLGREEATSIQKQTHQTQISRGLRSSGYC